MKKPARYVVGFLFDPTLATVALVRKNKPAWQEGLLNGVGGKIEIGEQPEWAMDREFDEEAGIKGLSWKLFAIFRWKSRHHPEGAELYCYQTTGNPLAVKSRTAEKVSPWLAASVCDRPDTVAALRWMLQMARGFYFNEGFKHYEVQGVPLD